jgi:Xaa-Pro aminopeptidase
MEEVPKIPKSEFADRIRRIQEGMAREKLDACLVYGDEYRKENLRYISNYWPIFERGAVAIPFEGDPIVIGAPECEELAKEMSVWPDIRVIKDFTCVTVPEEIDYPLAHFTSFGNISKELSSKRKIKRLGVIGIDAMPATIHSTLSEAFKGVEIVNGSKIILDMRLLKSKNEVACLREAWRIADAGYEALLAAAVPGNTELYATGAAEAAARAAGAEHIVFMVFGSGKRTNTIVGRPTEKVIREGDMMMAAFAVQYEGYVSTVEFPFVAGREPSAEQRELIDALIVAEDKALKKLGPGIKAKEFVKAVKDHFKEKGMTKYDLYPPLHGCGCAEAESPYPDERSEVVFQPGMTVNTDVSLFGHPAGSNRIEEGFAITETGIEPLSQLVRKLSGEWLRKRET